MNLVGRLVFVVIGRFLLYVAALGLCVAGPDPFVVEFVLSVVEFGPCIAEFALPIGFSAVQTVFFAAPTGFAGVHSSVAPIVLAEITSESLVVFVVRLSVALTSIAGRFSAVAPPFAAQTAISATPVVVAVVVAFVVAVIVAVGVAAARERLVPAAFAFVSLSVLGLVEVFVEVKLGPVAISVEMKLALVAAAVAVAVLVAVAVIVESVAFGVVIAVVPALPYP